MTLTLKLCDDKQRWDSFVASSPQENVFCTTPFLDALGKDYDLLFVEKNSCPQLGAVVLKGDGQPIPALYPYQGILFDGSSCSMPYHARAKWTLKLTDFLLAEMEQRYELISFCLHHGVEDLRSFQWFHYHQPQRGQFKIELRYTGLLDLLAVPDFDAYLFTVRKVRRYEYRHAQSAGLTIEESSELDTLDRLHQLTFERQGIKRSPEEERLLLDISEAALSKDFGRLLLCRDKKGTATSTTLFLYDNRCGYYLFGANDPEYRKTGSGTYLILENIRRCKEKGLARVDFVGINSPNRGDFKTSFNAVPVPYFIATWGNPHSSSH